MELTAGETRSQVLRGDLSRRSDVLNVSYFDIEAVAGRADILDE